MKHTLHYGLDTDMCIYLLNGHPRVRARVAEVGVTALAVAIPIVGESILGHITPDAWRQMWPGSGPFSLHLGRRCCSSMRSPAEQFGASRPSYVAQADRLVILISSLLVWPCAMG